jgi:hypothetical protein
MVFQHEDNLLSKYQYQDKQPCLLLTYEVLSMNFTLELLSLSIIVFHHIRGNKSTDNSFKKSCCKRIKLSIGYIT